MLQGFCSTMSLFPTQLLPPLEGAGLLQYLLDVTLWTPPPQATEHDPVLITDQADHPPFSGTGNKHIGDMVSSSFISLLSSHCVLCPYDHCHYHRYIYS